MPTLITPPAAEPVTVAEAKLAARVDGSAHDALIGGLIVAAREQAEHVAGRRWITQAWRHELTDWPAADVALPQPDATAVAISYWTGAAWVSLAGSAFGFGPLNSGTAIAPAVGAAWPTLGDIAIGPRVRVDITSGAASAAGVPEQVKLYIKACVAYWIYNPSAMAEGGKTETSVVFNHLLDAVKVY
jgi:uncharacterized phiE125 gp8 family phage protein